MSDEEVKEDGGTRRRQEEARAHASKRKAARRSPASSGTDSDRPHVPDRSGRELAEEVDCDGGSDVSGGSSQPGRAIGGRARARKKKKARRGGFRIQAKQYALTYPQCPVDRAAFDTAFKLKFSPREFASAREEHKDGSYHLHVFVAFDKLVDVRSPRYFDMAIDAEVYHPNTQRCKNRAAWLQYISKGDDHGVLSGDVGFDPLREPLGKRKSLWQDYQWSQDFAATRALKPVTYPVRLVTTERVYEMFAPDPSHKKRNWWIVAPPNAGKTRWLNRTFAGAAIYSPRSGPYPFEGYSDQDIIIYDDREGVTFAEFASVLNTWAIITPIAGQIRYITKNWKLNHTRSVIVLSNKTIEESMEPEDHQRMKKRFIQIVNAVLMDPGEKSDSDSEVEQSGPQLSDMAGFTS